MNDHVKLLKYASILTAFLLVITYDRIQASAHAQNLMMGTIQFPSNLSTVPSLRVYRGGHKIPCEIDEDSKKITLTIPREPREESFYLLVTEGIQYQQVESDLVDTQNTIDYLFVPKKQPYSLYKLTLIHEREEPTIEPLQSYKHMFEPGTSQHFSSKKQKSQPKYSWKIAQESLPKETQRIPDNTIIVNYYPHLIESISGGSKFELPTIKMKSDLLTLVGSEKALHELSDSLLLSCLDHEPLHTTIQQKVRFGKLHTLVAPTA